MDDYTEADLHQIELQIKNGNFTWFINDDDKIYNQLTGWQTAHCPVNKATKYQQIDGNTFNLYEIYVHHGSSCARQDHDAATHLAAFDLLGTLDDLGTGEVAMYVPETKKLSIYKGAC